MSVWRQAAKQFMTLQLRERKIIFYATQVVIVWLAFVLLLEPMLQATEALQTQNRATSQQIQRLQQQSTVIQNALNIDLNQQVQGNIEDQQRVERELTAKIQQMTGSYIGANQMLALLENLLTSLPQVQLVAMENQPAAPLLIGAEPSAQPLLYKHRTRFIFHGNFASLQGLLAQLQRLSRQLHWVQLDYKVLTHPTAELQLELETVSESPHYVQI